MSLVPYVVEQTNRGERSYDIFSRPVSYTHLDVYKRQGAVKDEIMDVETLGCHLMAYLGEHYPQVLTQSYKLPEVPARQEEENDIAYGYRLLEAGAAKRGMRISGGELDTERMARVLLDEYRAGKLGRFTLETPEGTSI